MTGPGPTIHLSAEIAPWSRKGGLGDAVAGLAGALAANGGSTAVWSPLYEHTRVDAPRTPGEEITSPGGRRVPTWTRRPDAGGVEIDFVELPFPFAFDAVHTDTTPTHQEGLDPRNLMFGQVCAAMLGRRPPGVCFTHDWHGGAVHLYRHLCPGWRFVHVIHNFEYHGSFSWGAQVDRVLGPELTTAQRLLADASPSFAAMAVRASDAVVTVSPAYAAELRSGRVAHPYLGLLRERHVEGYLNGYDDQVWDPRTDPMIVADFGGPGPDRDRNREHLATRLGFAGERPIVVMVSRLIEQKGIDVLAGSPPDVEVATARVDAVLDCGVDLVLCGDPDGGPGGPLDRALAGVAHRRPGRFGYLPGYDDTTGHRLLAGADILLHPSRFEPCGLTQLHALAYGVIPVVHPVGGLGDTVPHNLDPDLGPIGAHLRDLTIDAVVEAVTACAAAVTGGAGRLVHRAMSQPCPWKDRKDPYVALVEALRSR